MHLILFIFELKSFNSTILLLVDSHLLPSMFDSAIIFIATSI